MAAPRAALLCCARRSHRKGGGGGFPSNSDRFRSSPAVLRARFPEQLPGRDIAGDAGRKQTSDRKSIAYALADVRGADVDPGSFDNVVAKNSKLGRERVPIELPTWPGHHHEMDRP